MISDVMSIRMRSTLFLTCITFIILLYPTAASLQSSHTSLSLSGAWSLQNANQSVTLSAAAVPGYVLATLTDEGLVGEPLERFNELETRWVAEDTWTYQRSFNIPELTLNAYTDAQLTFQVVDTVADVYLNDQHLAHLKTSHRPHRLSVRQRLRCGNNTLSVVLHPAVEAARQAYEAYPYEMPTNVAPGAFKHHTFLRKPASDLGWDWGPAFAPCGLPGDVDLLLYRVPVLTGVHLQQDSGAATTTLLLECEVLVPTGGGQGNLVANITTLGVDKQMAVAFSQPGSQFATMELVVATSLFQLWWPRGLGAQPLYGLDVLFVPRGHQCCSHGDGGQCADGGQQSEMATPQLDSTAQRPTDVVTTSGNCTSIYRRVGFRSVSLVTMPLPTAYEERTGRPFPAELQGNATGESFYFRVNGVAVFMKGANLIPLHIMRTSTSRANWDALLEATQAAHMNMLRVWGGGLYQADLFYDLCDERGILVWQEFMYGCAPYPLEVGALEESVREARYQVRRLAGHASVAIWGGNNEVEASFTGYPAVMSNQMLYAVDFDRLFSEAIGGVMRQLAPGAAYVDTSPSNGVFDSQGRGLAKPPGAAPTKRWGDTQDPRFGDVHYYNYVDNAFATATYPRAKFVSEFGYQSFPSWHAIRPYTSPQDWSPFSALSRSRQRHPEGDEQLLAQLRQHFRIPASWPHEGEIVFTTGNDKADGHQEAKHMVEFAYHQWIYLTQLQQVLAYETAFGVWRRGQSDPLAQTMGILYWQLNDIWPGYSWSSVNYGGRWKLLHYAVCRAYAPLVVSGVVEDGRLQVFLVSDLPCPSVPVTVTIRVVSLAPPLNATDPWATVVVQQPHTPGRRPGASVVWSGLVATLMQAVPSCSGAAGHIRCFVLLSAECEGDCPSSPCTAGRETAAAQSPAHGANDAAQASNSRPQPLSHAASSRNTASRLDMSSTRDEQLTGSSMRHVLSQPHVTSGFIISMLDAAPHIDSTHGVAAAAAAASAAQTSSMGAQAAPRVEEDGPVVIPQVAVWLAEFKDMQLPAPRLRLSAFTQASPSKVCFRVSCSSPALHVVLDTQLAGRFTDNVLSVVLPEQPVSVCFLGPAGSRVAAAALRHSVTVVSLVHYQEPAPLEAKGPRP